MDINLKNKIYQMFILGLEGPELANNANLVSALEEGLGGVIFFTQNIQNVSQFKQLVQDIKVKSRTMPFLSIDQEGGRVERTENLFGGKKYLSGDKFGGKYNLLQEQTAQIAQELKDFGINLNFAPVLDVNTNPNNPIIGERAFSGDTDEVIKCGKIVVDIYLNNGIIPCTKHFPGHGDASVDSHISLPKIDLDMKTMEEFHIKPFKEVKSPMVMVAHLHCTAFDKDVIPASLSENVVGYLRNTLGHGGLIITDDMVMGGVLGIDSTQACVKAINAGVNILLYRDSFDETINIVNNIFNLAKNDKYLRDNIEGSYDRIINFKKSFLPSAI